MDQNVSKIQPFENVKIYKEMYGHPDAVFFNFKWLYLAFTWYIYTKLKDFVKLGLHFMTM